MLATLSMTPKGKIDRGYDGKLHPRRRAPTSVFGPKADAGR
jgi:hypothetical protein